MEAFTQDEEAALREAARSMMITCSRFLRVESIHTQREQNCLVSWPAIGSMTSICLTW